MERVVLALTTWLVLASGCAEVEPKPEDGDPISGGHAGTGQAGNSDAADSGAASAQAGTESMDVDAGSWGLPEPCYEPLDCKRGDCGDYEPMEPICEGPAGWPRKVFDGVCGAYRYRYEGNSFSGSVTYWDLATGKTVAKLSFTDNPYPCMRRVAGDRTVFEQCDEVWLDDTCSRLTDAGVASD